MKRSTAITVLLVCLAPALASAQMYVYPQKGQSAEQQQTDEGACHSWAVQQTGYNPGFAPTASTGADGSVIRGGARGAVGGAVIGAIAGNAGKGAAIGAAGGGLMGGMRRRDRERSSANSAAAGQAAYQRAYAACLQGRGYSVN